MFRVQTIINFSATDSFLSVFDYIWRKQKLDGV